MEATQAPTNNGQTATPAAPWLEKLKQQGLVPLLLGGATFIGLVIALILWASAPEYRVLYSNLSEADGGRIINELETRQIKYQLNGAGTILVPADQVHKLRLQMAEQGLPNGGNVGFALMDNQAFGISQFAEQVNFQRALEGELASSMESLGPVQRARVHLAMAKPSVFVREREPAKASVVLTLYPGRTLGEGQVQAIIHMVSSSVPELTPDHVTVVDQHGALLSNNNRDNQLSSTKLEYIQQVEHSFQQRIENILAPILGRQNIKAQVVAHIDFSKREATAERYTPNQTPDAAAVRSIQRNISVQGNGDGPMGIPGALSNTPPGIAASPVEIVDDTDSDDAGTTNRTHAVQQDQLVNYEVDRLVEHIDQQRGQLQRLSVAVVVNHRTAINEDGESELVPRSDEELQYIQRLVRQAMGFSEQRGDELEVVNSLFIQEAETTEVLEWYQQPAVLDMAQNVARYVAVLVAIIVLYLILVRPFLQRYFELKEIEAEAALERSQGTLRAVVGDDDAEPSSRYSSDYDDWGPSTESSFHWPQQHNNKSYTQALAKAKDIAKNNPRQVARILQNWMNEEEQL